jgi:hypothetical protein
VRKLKETHDLQKSVVEIATKKKPLTPRSKQLIMKEGIILKKKLSMKNILETN